MKPQIEDTTPWYKQFWPWFIILLPASVVVAGLGTVYIAFHNADSLVNDNYYKDGLAINRSLDQDEMAKTMGLGASVEWDKTTGEILVTVWSDSGHPELDKNQPLTLLLLHPTDQKSDFGLELTAIAPGYYRASVEQPLRYRYYLRLLPREGNSWRLNGELNFENSTLVSLGGQ